MKTVKIKFVGFWESFDPNLNIVYKILKDHYNVVITDEADYIICSMFGTPYEYCNYPQVRIMYSGENYVPDFNVVDYAICPYPVEFLDRSCYRPVFLGNFNQMISLQNKNRDYPASILDEKPYFANFIASHESEYNIRGDFFKKLSNYKRVESPGSYLNNMPDSKVVSFFNSSKTDFQRKCKFTLCFESTKHEGFITEKITDAFYSDTIPVYYGSSTVTDIFNPKAFINCSDYESFDAVIEKIIELDNDDEKYLEMLRQPVFVDPKYVEKTISNLENFIVSIFDQPLEQAYRRSRVYSAKIYDDFLKKASNRKSNSFKSRFRQFSLNSSLMYKLLLPFLKIRKLFKK